MDDIHESQQHKVKGIVDIVFLIDATGSMQPCIDAVKNSVRMFIGVLNEGANNLKPVKEWRAKVVGYRDFWCDNEPIVDNPFTDDVKALESQLGALVAEGGGDEPESLLEGIYHVSEMGQTEREEPLSPDKWRARNTGSRIVIVFTDASYHPHMAVPPGGDIDDVINSVMKHKITLLLLGPGGDDPGAGAPGGGVSGGGVSGGGVSGGGISGGGISELARIDKATHYRYEYDETLEDGAAKGLEALTFDKRAFQEVILAMGATTASAAWDSDSEFL